MKLETTNVFYYNYSSKKRFNINRWWTRSGKTYNLLVLFFYWLIFWKIDEGTFYEKGILTIVRKYASTLKWSCQRDFEEIVDYYNYRWLLDINKQDRTYKYNWRVIEFIWADDQQKLRWWKRDILYCNEANELQYKQEFFQLMIRTTWKIFLDFNPDDESIWINTELEQKRRLEEKDVRVIISTYKDNPHLGELQVKEIEMLEKTDEQYWNVYWLGNYWKLEGVIYSNWEEIEKVPENARLRGYWLDFWFNHPTAFMWIYEYNDCIIVDEEFYTSWLITRDIIWILKEKWIDKRMEIIADNARPEAIAEIHQAGFNCKPCIKWPDSVLNWINTVKSYKVFITRRSLKTLKEIRRYSWMTDKNWESIDKPIKLLDDAMDSMRYWISHFFKSKIKKKFVFVNVN